MASIFHTFSKLVEGDIHTGLPGAVGTESPPYITDGMEDETEEINRMEPVDSTLVCDSYSILERYKSWVGDWIGN